MHYYKAKCISLFFFRPENHVSHFYVFIECYHVKLSTVFRTLYCLDITPQNHLLQINDDIRLQCAIMLCKIMFTVLTKINPRCQV